MGDVPARLRGEHVEQVVSEAGRHFSMLLNDGAPDLTAFHGATRRLLSSLVEAGELKPDFDSEAVLDGLFAIEDSINPLFRVEGSAEAMTETTEGTNAA